MADEPPINPWVPRTPAGRRALAAAAVVIWIVAGALIWWRGAGASVPVHGPLGPALAVPAATVGPDSKLTAAATPGRAPEAGPRKPVPQVLPVSNAFTTLDDYRRRRAAMPQTPAPLIPPPAGRTPETELGRVTFVVRDYRAAFGSNPVGSNKEITRALMGGNERGTRFLDPATASLDAKGELLDAWGRPYFFHALSGTMMEIRSAGPDGKIFTADDLVR